MSGLLETLYRRKTVCVVGYELSEEAGLPHFHDILTGVWSGKPRDIDPFSTVSGRETVLAWFAWRAQLVNKVRRQPLFQSCIDLLAALAPSTIATQAVDGQLRSNGLTAVHELYGNIFSGKCTVCGEQKNPFEPAERHSIWPPTCSNCNGDVLPDVTMFGWNRKTDALKLVHTAFTDAEAMILIGASQLLAPFCGADINTASHCPILQISPKSYLLSDRSGTSSAMPTELSDEFERTFGIRIAAPGAQTLNSNLKFLSDLLAKSRGLGN